MRDERYLVGRELHNLNTAAAGAASETTPLM
jgi:hypothetical protein